MSRYRFIEAESSRYAVTQLSRIVQVSRTAYYEWQERTPSERAQADAALTAKIRAIHAAPYCPSEAAWIARIFAVSAASACSRSDGFRSCQS